MTGLGPANEGASGLPEPRNGPGFSETVSGKARVIEFLQELETG
jgi:hypothetical protein